MATKVKTGVIDSSAITSALIANASITADDLHTTLDLTGKTVTVSTASAGDNDTSVASTAYVDVAIANLADSAPSTLNTLNELAAALGDDANYATTTTAAIAGKLPLAGGTLTGALTATEVNISNGNLNFTKVDGVGINTKESLAITIDSDNNDGARVFSVLDGSGSTLMQVTDTGHATFGASVTGTIINSGTQSAVGIGTTTADANVAEMGPGYINLGRDDTTTSKQLLFSKNGAIHSYLETSSSGLNIGGANVGIGVAAPSWNLHVAGRALVADTTARLPFYVSRAGGGAVTNAATIVSGAVAYFNGNIAGSDALRIGSMDNGTGAYYIDVSNYNATAAYDLVLQPYLGNVGIGHTAPSSLLDVRGSLAANGTADTPNAYFINNQSGATSGSIYIGASTGIDWKIGKNVTGISGNTNFSIADSSGNRRFDIDASGNVGIGTAAPNSRLHVDHSLSSTAANIAESKSVATISVSPLRNGSAYGMYFGNDGTNTGYVQVTDGTNASSMNINPFGGNVGIRTSTPASALDIGGSGIGTMLGVKGNVNNQVNIAHSSNTTWGMLLTNSDSSNDAGYHNSTSGNNTSVAVVNVGNDALHLGTNNTERVTIAHDGSVRMRQNLQVKQKFEVSFNDSSQYTIMGSVMGHATNQYIHIKTNQQWANSAMDMYRVTGFYPYSSMGHGYFGAYKYSHGDYQTAPYGMVHYNLSGTGTIAVAVNQYYTSASDGRYLVLVCYWPTSYNGLMVEHISAGSSYGSYAASQEIVAFTNYSDSTTAQW